MQSNINQVGSAITRLHPQGMGGPWADCVGTSLNWASGTFELSRTLLECFGRNVPKDVFEHELIRMISADDGQTDLQHEQFFQEI